MSGFKGRGLTFNLPPNGAAPAPAPRADAEPVTGVMHTYGIAQELHSMREKVQQLESERGAQAMDAATIRPSRWANRHESSLTGAEFEALKTEIADAGGNVQPIKVRPVADAGEGGHKYEIVFGHRRHRACLELCLPVLAVVQPMDDRELYREMERENRGRKDLSAWEQGVMYRRALDEGLFPSLRMLAQAIGRAPQDVSEAVRIASLPAEVLAAFPSPNAIQFRFAKALADAAKVDRDTLIARAKAMVSDGLTRTPAETFAALTAPKEAAVRRSDTPAPSKRTLTLANGAQAKIKSDGKRVTLELDASLLPPESWESLEQVLRKLTKAGKAG